MDTSEVVANEKGTSKSVFNGIAGRIEAVPSLVICQADSKAMPGLGGYLELSKLWRQNLNHPVPAFLAIQRFFSCGILLKRIQASEKLQLEVEKAGTSKKTGSYWTTTTTRTRITRTM